MNGLAHLPYKDQTRCLFLHKCCQEVRRLLTLKWSLTKALERVCIEQQNSTWTDPKTGEHKLHKVSKMTLRRAFYKWRHNPRPEALAADYKPKRVQIPGDLIIEYQRRCSLPGMEEYSAAYDSLVKDWKAGEDIPGLGTWQTWWVSNPGTRNFPLPAQAPDFPVSDRGLYNHRPAKAVKVWGNRGAAEALKHLPHLDMDTSGMPSGRVYVSDDVRLDILCVDESTARPTEVRAYIMMDWATRYIPSFVLRPANAMLQTDVDAMIVRGLQTLGVGADFTSFLLFERGTVACSNEAQRLLESASEGRIKVIRTGMNGGERWLGAGQDRSSGHWMSKGVIERFMLELHRLLRDLPGQRGNDYRKQPAHLGWVGQASASVKNSMVEEAQKLSEIQLVLGKRVKLELPLLTFSQVNWLVREAIDRHNNNRDHTYQGFGKITLRESAPGSWEAVA